MSVVSHTHDLVPFVAGKSEPMADQRLSQIVCKQTKVMTAKGVKALPSVCVSIPELCASDVAPHLDALMPYVVQMVHGAQDGIVRALYESSKGARATVHDDEISMARVLAYLAAAAAGDRLSTAGIVAWFDSSVLPDTLTVLIAEKARFDLNTPEQLEVVRKSVTAWRDILCMLAGKQVSLSPAQAQNIGRMLTLAEEQGDESVMCQKLRARHTELTARPDIESALGF